MVSPFTTVTVQLSYFSSTMPIDHDGDVGGVGGGDVGDIGGVAVDMSRLKKPLG